jgi:hypothetical protein
MADESQAPRQLSPFWRGVGSLCNFFPQHEPREPRVTFLEKYHSGYYTAKVEQIRKRAELAHEESRPVSSQKANKRVVFAVVFSLCFTSFSLGGLIGLALHGFLTYIISSDATSDPFLQRFYWSVTLTLTVLLSGFSLCRMTYHYAKPFLNSLSEIHLEKKVNKVHL